MIKIGITGSIASGKSTVAKMLSKKNIQFLTPIMRLEKFIKKIFLKTKYIKH